ncbi:MAG: elongation factor P [Candidatus Omnitrophica bacterium]|nr:elongation factor P [Candidatus Omnitrophota bacterium]
MNGNELRVGMVVRLDGELQEVVSAQHVKPGKGPAYMKCKLRVVKTDRSYERTVRSSEKVELVKISDEAGRYLYKDQTDAYFLNEEAMEELQVPVKALGDKMLFLREGDDVKIKMAGPEVIGVEVSDFTNLKVSQTDPGFKGDTVQATRKPATLETGAVVQVPLFVNEGDTIKVDTRTGEYVTRV